MLYTLFFSRMRELSDEAQQEYHERSDGLHALATAEHPGFLGMKTYVAEDGERLTVVRFTDEESQRAWKADPVHREGQEKGRTDYYEWYRLAVCEEVRAYGWEREK